MAIELVMFPSVFLDSLVKHPLEGIPKIGRVQPRHHLIFRYDLLIIAGGIQTCSVFDWPPSLIVQWFGVLAEGYGHEQWSRDDCGPDDYGFAEAKDENGYEVGRSFQLSANKNGPSALRLWIMGIDNKHGV